MRSIVRKEKTEKNGSFVKKLKIINGWMNDGTAIKSVIPRLDRGIQKAKLLDSRLMTAGMTEKRVFSYERRIVK
ncbi:MAG: hypothetical protein HY755_05700 [Nitrospirae bacterium]|nr:hypothetical protein [Nitrospirota bacterium]